MASFLVGLLRFVFFLGALSLSFGAILAAFGFVHPLFDAFNHFQPLWFAGTLACLLLTGVFFRNQRSRALMIALSATGFLASGIMVMPEIIAGFLARPVAPASAPTYRLMTYNIFGMNYDMDQVASMIFAENPDIVAIEEYFPEQRDYLHELLVGDYPHFDICMGGKRANLAVYSRLPFTNLSDTEPCHWDAERRTGFLAVHFAPDGTRGFTVSATQLDWPVQVSPLFGSGDLLTRIDQMTARQRGEFVHLANGTSKIDGPFMLVGDFNSTPWSYALRRFAQDNGLVRQTRNLPTFPKQWFFDTWRETPAILPLDQVMTRDGIVVTHIFTGAPAGSDHLPVIVDFFVSP